MATLSGKNQAEPRYNGKMFSFGCSVAAGSELEIANRLFEGDERKRLEASQLYQYENALVDSFDYWDNIPNVEDDHKQVWEDTEWQLWGAHSKDCYTTMVAEHFNFEFKNYAQPGSGPNWNIQRCMELIHRNEIQPHNVILFGISHSARQHYYTKERHIHATHNVSSQNDKLVPDSEVEKTVHYIPTMQPRNAFEDGLRKIWNNPYNEYEKLIHGLYGLFTYCKLREIKIFFYGTTDHGKLFTKIPQHETLQQFLHKAHPTTMWKYQPVELLRNGVRAPDYEEVRNQINTLCNMAEEMSEYALYKTDKRKDYEIEGKLINIKHYNVLHWIEQETNQRTKWVHTDLMDRKINNYEEFIEGYYNPYGHPNKKGHRIIADAMTRELRGKI